MTHDHPQSSEPNPSQSPSPEASDVALDPVSDPGSDPALTDPQPSAQTAPSEVTDAQPSEPALPADTESIIASVEGDSDGVSGAEGMATVEPTSTDISADISADITNGSAIPVESIPVEAVEAETGEAESSEAEPSEADAPSVESPVSGESIVESITVESITVESSDGETVTVESVTTEFITIDPAEAEPVDVASEPSNPVAPPSAPQSSQSLNATSTPPLSAPAPSAPTRWQQIQSGWQKVQPVLRTIFNIVVGFLKWVWRVWNATLPVIRSILPESLKKLPDWVLTGLAIALLSFLLWISSLLSTDQPAVTATPPGQVATDNTTAPVPPKPAPDPAKLAAIQEQLAQATSAYGDGLVAAVQVNVWRDRLVVQLAPTWYDLDAASQDRAAAALLKQFNKLKFGSLELVDADNTLLARSPVVGKTMVVLQRQSLRPPQPEPSPVATPVVPEPSAEVIAPSIN